MPTYGNIIIPEEGNYLWPFLAIFGTLLLIGCIYLYERLSRYCEDRRRHDLDMRIKEKVITEFEKEKHKKLFAFDATNRKVGIGSGSLTIPHNTGNKSNNEIPVIPRDKKGRFLKK